MIRLSELYNVYYGAVTLPRVLCLGLKAFQAFRKKSGYFLQFNDAIVRLDDRLGDWDAQFTSGGGADLMAPVMNVGEDDEVDGE